MSTVERQRMDVDIVCVGFGPATGGFLTTLTRAMTNPDGSPALESKVMPGMPLQVMCYERADDIGFGVSGVVSRARAIRASFPDVDFSQIPNAHPVGDEKVAYLFDPTGASRRGGGAGISDAMFKMGRLVMPKGPHAVELPFIPPFLRKDHGWVMSIGQFNQWVGQQLMATGLVQVWPGSPVGEPIIENNVVKGVRLTDQGVNKKGEPEGNYMPGMDIFARLTVVGDGPIGPVGRKLDQHFGLPEGNHQRDWAVGMKAVVDLPDHCTLKPGTVIHTLGFPEPEIFGFMYIYPNRTASLGIFVPSWFDTPVRTSYRYLQHWMMHPYLWRWLEGGTLRSWGAKSLQEAGVRGEPHLAGDGYARIGEGSGSTNVLTNSGVDEAWHTGVLLAEGAIELLKRDAPFTKAHLEEAYVARRRKSTLDRELQIAKKARDGFQKGFLPGLMGTGLAGITGGRINITAKSRRPSERIPTLDAYYKGRISKADLDRARAECAQSKQPLHDKLMTMAGWPEIPYDGKLLMSHQDALLKGGKVQAAAGFADHVRFARPEQCAQCGEKICIEICSAQAIMPGEGGGMPEFDREKCIHCGACIWNCVKANPNDPERANVEFSGGSGGLHSNEN